MSSFVSGKFATFFWQQIEILWHRHFLIGYFFSRFDDMYDLSLVFTDGKTKRSRDASFSKSCADFFDENGLLCQDLVEKAVLALHKSLADKQD